METDEDSSRQESGTQRKAVNMQTGEQDVFSHAGVCSLNSNNICLKI